MTRRASKRTCTKSETSEVTHNYQNLCFFFTVEIEADCNSSYRITVASVHTLQLGYVKLKKNKITKDLRTLALMTELSHFPIKK